MAKDFGACLQPATRTGVVYQMRLHDYLFLTSTDHPVRVGLVASLLISSACGQRDNADPKATCDLYCESQCDKSRATIVVTTDSRGADDYEEVTPRPAPLHS